MKSASFEYISSSSKEEVLNNLAEYGEDCRILAGGQSLVPSMNFRLARPEVLIDINNCDDLNYLKVENNKLIIGALTRHSQFQKKFASGILPDFLSIVCPHIAHYPIRIRGTFCGSLAHADPASEWCSTFLALNGTVTAESKKHGSRVINSDDFFKTMFTTSLEDDELLVSVELPMLDDTWRLGFEEFSRISGAFALAIAVVSLRINNGKISQSRISIGSVSSKPLLCIKSAEFLEGKIPEDSLLKEASEIASEETEVLEDLNASIDYKRELIKVMTYRALKKALLL